LKCEFCDNRYSDDLNGLTKLTFHNIIKHSKIINKEFDDPAKYQFYPFPNGVGKNDKHNE